ncbi:hypothetical protein LPW26_06080 [Rhodopseudomonas sp. HC1]|uniref:hypothetical protein n=1 Tax=Rhodopseudomonas infernalis TaxID=2897386 RepID=UPI001EE7B089|nr:hypothetical protein [Rhodopseudomonas infernalis]MCG6204195.1 hypothetical protein [Rhodopseudomonas infernalis]
MTLARTALRLCVAECLKGDEGGKHSFEPAGFSGAFSISDTPRPRPTIAAERVYDSRMSDFAPEALAGDALPTIVVLTDNDEGDQLSEQNGGPPFRRMIEVVLELGMIQSVKDGADFIVGYPDTDARHEASLDVLEFQAVRRLAYDPAPLPFLFRSIARIRKSECHRQVVDDAGTRIAVRILTLHCEISDDQVQVRNAAIGSEPTGLDVLPDPLRKVAKAMPEGSHGAEVCAAIAASLSILTRPAMKRIDIELTNANHAPSIKAKLDFSDPS